MIKISNCPFCGSEAHILNDFNNSRCVAICDNCKANISISYGKRKRKVNVTDNDFTGKSGSWEYESVIPEVIALWERRPYTYTKVVDGNLPGRCPKDRKVEIKHNPNMNREEAVKFSFERQIEDEDATPLLSTIRGLSVTVAMLYDLIKDVKEN